jgi:hypothetical protein
VQVIRPTKYDQKERGEFRRNLLLAGFLSLGGLIVFILPVTGLISSDNIQAGLGFWGPVVLGLGLVCVGVWFGWLAWLYYDEHRIQARVITILEQTLNDDYKYLYNLNLLANRSTNQIGASGGVLLGPYGALVLQICRYRGTYACEGDTWYKYKRPPSNNPTLESEKLLDTHRIDDSPNWQVIRAAREVKAWLSVRELPQVSVQPIVILAQGKIRFARRPSCPIVELWYLETYIKNTLLTTVNLETETEPISGVVVAQIMERLQN